MCFGKVEIWARRKFSSGFLGLAASTKVLDLLTTPSKLPQELSGFIFVQSASAATSCK